MRPAVRVIATFTLGLLTSAICWADRYGVNEAMAENGPMPGWLWPAAFFALLGYHLHNDSKMASERAALSRELGQQVSATRAQNEQLRVQLEAARAEAEKFRVSHHAYVALIDRWDMGDVDDDVFLDALLEARQTDDARSR